MNADSTTDRIANQARQSIERVEFYAREDDVPTFIVINQVPQSADAQEMSRLGL